MSLVLPTQAYELKLAPQPAPFSVLSFSGHEDLSELYRYDIEFTCALAGIPMASVIGRPARFTIDPIDPDMAYLEHMFGEQAAEFSVNPPAYVVHGLITQFSELDTSADETRYRVRLEPTLADLDRGMTSRLFQQQTIEEIVTSTLRHCGYQLGVDFEFQLRAQYIRHEYVTQYHETTFAFIRRVCAQEGIWFRFEQRKDRAVVVFGDDLDAYLRKHRVVPYRRDSGLESAGNEAIRTLEKHMKRVPESVKLHDYNHRQADMPLLVEQNAARGDTTTNATDYHWGEHYRTLDEGNNIAKLRHQDWLAQQIVFKGTGNVFGVQAGEVIKPEPEQPDAPYGIMVTGVTCSASRRQSYQMAFTGIPADRVWRVPMATVKRPVIEGILPARISSPGNYKYAYLTEEGWYVVKLPFDLDTWSPGGESRPVRFAKPYSGDTYGQHFPLIDGAEVALSFTDGNPDRPVIMGAMHDSMNPDLVNNLNHTRNLIRTASQNELRMEDREGVEHIHLTTPNQTSELNLGHMVDGQRKERGLGAELRTDGHVAIRAAKGILMTAQARPGAEGKQLDMREAIAQLENALQTAKTLQKAVTTAKATSADTASQEQAGKALKELEMPGILVGAPAPIGVASGSDIQLAAQGNLSVVAQKNADISVINRFTVAAGEAVSLFAQTLGVKLFAAKGKVEIQAQGDAMGLAALKDVTVSSVNGKVHIQAKEEILLECGGGFVQIKGGSVTVGGPEDFFIKACTMQKKGAESLKSALPVLPISESECLYSNQIDMYEADFFDADLNHPWANLPYRVTDKSGNLLASGTTDNTGLGQPFFTRTPQNVVVWVGEDGGWDVEEGVLDDADDDSTEFQP